MKRLAAAVVLFVASAAAAAACEHGTVDSAAVGPVPASAWRDGAKFSFLIGRDDATPEAGMVLMTRLRSFPAFTELRAAAAQWQPTYVEMVALTEEIARNGDLADRLTDLCEDLDRAGLLGAPLDVAAWMARLSAVRARLDVVIARGAGLQASLKRYSDLLDAAAEHYRAGRHTPIPEADIGPDPSEIADALRGVRGRWHAIFSDLEFARRSLPAGPDGASETAMDGLDQAAASLRSVAAETAALSADLLSVEASGSLANGDYLYEACAGAEDRYVRLETMFRPDGVLVLQGETLLIAPPPADDKVTLWRFVRAGGGFWTISSGTRASSLLDYVDDVQAAFPLRLSNGLGPDRASQKSQLWRCYTTRFPGYVRLANAKLGESRSLDTFSNNPRAVQLPTGFFSGQFWRILPQCPDSEVRCKASP